MKQAILLCAMLTSGWAMPAQAQVIDADLIPPPVTAPADEHAAKQSAMPYAHPTLAAEARWPGATVALILGMFVAAAGVGIVVKMEAEDDPAASHVHGAHGHGAEHPH